MAEGALLSRIRERLCRRRCLGASLVFACSIATADALAAPPAIAAGGVHSVALGTDGYVRTWGDDSAGELGTGRPINSAIALPVRNLPTVVGISAGDNTSLAWTADGQLFAWGANSNGQLATGSAFFAQPVPIRVDGLPPIVSASVGGGFVVAADRSGVVYKWGAGVYRPVPVSGLPAIKAVSAGGAHVIALATDGSVWTWGSNANGALGDGTDQDRADPARVLGVPSAVQTCAAGSLSMMVSADGSLWEWGANSSGQQANGTLVSPLVPHVVPVPARVQSVACGGPVIALDVDGNVWSWGANDVGQAGQGVISNNAPIARVAPLPPVVAVASSGRFAFAVTSSGQVFSWGDNQRGYLANGGSLPSSVPSLATSLDRVVMVAAGDAHAMALRSDGSVVAWGNNFEGQLGDGAPASRTTPFTVRSLPDVASVSAGYGITMAVQANGSVWCWGNNSQGGCGDGSFLERSLPVQVVGLKPASSVATGLHHGVVLQRDGTVATWGYNSRGELGDGTTTSRPRANTIAGISNAVAVAAGLEDSFALLSDGRVMAWGENADGQLGFGSSQDQGTPRLVPALSGIAMIAAGPRHTLALTRDGNVLAWGDNSFGQLGDGTLASAPLPQPVPALADVVAISAGVTHSMALKRDGSVWAWGGNRSGQVGDGTYDSRLTPYRIPDLQGIVAIAAGDQRNFYGNTGTHSLALSSGGVVWAWGENYFGELGDGTLVRRETPVVTLREDGAGDLSAGNWYLDLDPSAPDSIPPSKIPPFAVLSQLLGGDVTATVRYAAADVGKFANTYVFALAPSTLVKRAPAGGEPLVVGHGVRSDGTKDTSVSCVLAQLNAAGALQAVSVAALQAYVSGVIASQAQAVKIIDRVAALNVAGATFYVGYGATPSSMNVSGTNRSVITVPADTVCKPQPPQTGWWWDPQQGGRGYSMEVQGAHLFMAAFLYDDAGKSTWYVASGKTSLDGALFSGDLVAYRGGQTLTGAYAPPQSNAVVGSIVLTFNDASTGTLAWPGGTLPLTRFPIVPNGLSAPTQAGVPDGGWWWNPDEGGRGYFIEWQGANAFIASYMYDTAGSPVWYLAQVPTPVPASITGNWQSLAGGQSLTGPPRSASVVDANAGALAVQFQARDKGTLTLPDGRRIPITRFLF